MSDHPHELEAATGRLLGGERVLVCVLEHPTSAENLGAVLRSVDALGVGKMYVVSDKWTQEQLGRPGRAGRPALSAIVRSSVSASKWVYARHFATTRGCLQHLGSRGFVSLATSPHTVGRVNLDLMAADFTRYRKLAVWFGNEARGLTAEASAACQACVQIPMSGIVESLNLAVAAGIVLSHIACQRRRARARSEKPAALIQPTAISREFSSPAGGALGPGAARCV